MACSATKVCLYLLAFLLVQVNVLFVHVSAFAQSNVSQAQGNVLQKRAGDIVPGEIIVKLKGDSAPGDTNMGGSSGQSGLSGSAFGRSGSSGGAYHSAQAAQKAQRFMSKATAKKGLRLKNAFSKMGVYHFSVKDGDKVEDAVAEMKADPDVEYAEPNYIFSKASLGEVQQEFSIDEVARMAVTSSSYQATGAPIEVMDAWSALAGSGEPVVAVLDTGLVLTHPVFTGTGAVWTNSGEVASNGVDDDHNGYVDDVHGWNFVSNSGTIIDDDNHGTHVSGIILATTQDIYSGAPYAASKIKIMPLKFLDGDGYGKTSDAIKAIYYAVNNGATILNNSWGGPTYSASLHEAIVYAYNNGVVFVAAAGNNGSNNDNSPMYPASYDVPNVVSVAATRDDDLLASFSNYGRISVDLASPGVFILSTLPVTASRPSGMGTMSGTSMATPFVSGLAALIKIEKPTMLSYQVKQIILGNVDSVVDLNNVTLTEGRINAEQTVLSAQSASVSSSQPGYTFVNADRGLASSIAGGGCGTVAKMMADKGGPGTGSGAPESWSILIGLILLALPVLLYNVLRKKDGKQKRQHERFKINSEVKVKVGERELVANVSTISQGGVQINTDQLLEQGGILSMVIRSPDGQEQIAVEGRVVWSETQKAYGVQFAETSQTVRERIANWSRALVKAS